MADFACLPPNPALRHHGHFLEVKSFGIDIYMKKLYIVYSPILGQENF
jgi:hypothetical protein